MLREDDLPPFSMCWSLPAAHSCFSHLLTWRKTHNIPKNRTLQQILKRCRTLMLQRASQEVKEAQMFREKMGHVSEWMARVQLPRSVKEKIRAYYTEVCFHLSIPA